MEDSFRLRVDKIFGSLASSSSSTPAPSSSLSSLWCLTDAEIERREWNRDKDSPEPEQDPPRFKGSFAKIRERPDREFRSELEMDLADLDDDLVDDARSRKPDEYNDEEWEIKSSIGLDCTLDYEEEEDKYDKVAIGKEKAGDRLYMKDITDYGINVDSCYELPDSFKDVNRDPRANHMAAKIRLKEDAEAAKTIDSLRVSEKEAPAVADAQTSASEDNNLKSILKRKDNQLDSKSQKRVRFDSECKYDRDEESEGDKDITMESSSTEEALVLNEASILHQDYSSGVPDYMRNPSKYTRYTFDSSDDVDEKSNGQAYLDFLKQLKSSKSGEWQSDDGTIDLPKSVTFIPKRKTGDATMVENCTESKHNRDGAGKESLHRRGLLVGIAAEDSEDSNEACAMEEDEPEIAADRRNNSQRLGRQYRLKAGLESEESII